MPEYINPPGPPTDPDTIAQDAFDVIRSYFSNYEPQEGQLATIVITTLALRAAQINDLAQMIPKAIFRWYGANVVNLPPFTGAPSAFTASIIVRDGAGYLIESGTEFDLTSAESGDSYAFAVDNDTNVPVGQTSVIVTMTAQEEGTQSNNISGGIVTPREGQDFIIGASQVGVTAGGADEEDDDDYLDRLTRRTSLPVRPVWASDFSNLVLLNFPQVYRALMIDNFIPPSTTNAERAVAGLILDANGNDLEPTLGDEVRDFISVQREWGFIFNLLNPVYTAVDVSYTFVPRTGYDPDDVAARSTEALTTYLSPSVWGTPPGDSRGFEMRPNVYLWEIVTELNNVLGLDRLTSLTLGKNGGAQLSSDLLLDGPIPLPTPGIILADSAV